MEQKESISKKHLMIYIILLTVFLAIFGFYELFVYLFLFIEPSYTLIFIIGAVIWFVLSISSKKDAEKSKEPVVSNKYRIYLAIILTIIALSSILLLSNKTIDTYEIGRTRNPPLPDKMQNIVPPIIVVSAVTIFVAATTTIKKFYPYSAIFASAVLFVVYANSLEYVSSYFQYPHPIRIYIWFSAFTIPLIVIATSSWKHEKLGMVYPIALSIVLGIVAGVEIPRTYENIELFGTFYPAIVFIFLFGITTFILYMVKFKYKSLNNYFISALKVTSSLVVYSIVLVLSGKFIFWHFYLGA